MKLTPSPFPPGALIVAYTRDSGGDDQNLSTAQQEQIISRWCDENQLTLLRCYVDDAAPGSSAQTRKAFQQMISYFHNGGKATGLVIWSTNRFGRNLDDVQFYQADLRRRGVTIHSLTDDIPSGAAGRLIEFALQWKDQVFLEQMSGDVKRGLAYIVQQYGAVPGVPPRGFRRVPIHVGKRRDGTAHTLHRWEPDPASIPLIQRAYQLRAQGATHKQISEATGLYRSVNCWATFYSNPIYKGVLQFGDLTIPDYCPPIVPPDLWEAAQPKPTRRQPQRARQINSDYLLSGMAYCQLCGSALASHPAWQWDYYDCARKMRRKDCPARAIPRAPFERAVIETIQAKIINVENLLEIQTQTQAERRALLDTSQARIHKLTESIASAQRTINNLTAAIGAQGHSPALLSALASAEQQLQKDTKDKQDLQNNTAPIPQHSPASLQQISDQLTRNLHDPDPQRVRATLAGYIVRIIVARTDDEIRGVIEYIPPLNTKSPDGDLCIVKVPPQGHREMHKFTTTFTQPIKRTKAPRRQ